MRLINAAVSDRVSGEAQHNSPAVASGLGIRSLRSHPDYRQPQRPPQPPTTLLLAATLATAVRGERTVTANPTTTFG